MIKYFTLFYLFFAVWAKGQLPTSQHLIHANELAKKYIIVDGHVDLPYRLKVKNFQLQREYIGIPVSNETGNFDYIKAKKGGLDAPFMSIYIPASYETAAAQTLADSLIQMVEFISKSNSDKFEIAKSPTQVQKIFRKGKIALPMGMENGSPIGKINDVFKYKKKGISYITLCHGKDNQICDSSYDTTHTWKGISPFGKRVVSAMMSAGVMIDISHVSDEAFYDVMKITQVPVIASHSSARKFTPGFERNMSDDMIKRLAKNGGVIMVNFASTFISGEVSDYRKSLQIEINELLKSKGLDPASNKAEEVIDEFLNSQPKAFTDVKNVADHIDHIKKIAGINHIGLGSDFDGVGNSLPTGLKDASDYPNLIAELLKRGYTDQEIKKICSGNLFRVWNKVLSFASDSNQIISE